MKPRKFKLHFNRINMQRGNPNVWTIHTNKKCIQVMAVNILVPLISTFKPEARQPRAYFSGTGIVTVRNGIGTIRGGK